MKEQENGSIVKLSIWVQIHIRIVAIEVFAKCFQNNIYGKIPRSEKVPACGFEILSPKECINTVDELHINFEKVVIRQEHKEQTICRKMFLKISI